MKNIVFILGSYYPYYSAVGRCLGNIVEELDKENKITVICINTQMNSMEREKYLNHDIIRVYTKTVYKRNRLEKKVKNSIGVRKYIAIMKLNLHRIVQVFRILISKESIDKKLVNKYLEELNKIEKIDLIIPTCNPFESVIAAMKYKEKNSVKIVPILFDKFSMSSSLHRLNINKQVKMTRNLKLEEKMMNYSERILGVESWRKHIETEFPKYSYKFCLIEHPLIKKIEAKQNYKFFDNKKINIVYTGILSNEVRSPMYILNIFSRILKKNKDIILHFFSMGNATVIVDAYSKKFQDQIVNHGWVTSEEVKEAMVNSSYLLSIGAYDTTQMSSKIFEYMSCCKPIIHSYVRDDDPANKILEYYPISLCIEQDEDKMDCNIKKLQAFLDENTLKNIEFSQIKEIFFNGTPKYSAEVIEKI